MFSPFSLSWDFGHRFQVDLDFDVWPRCRERAEFFEIIARHAEIVALHHRGPMESHTRRFARLRGSRPIEVEGQRHDLRHAANAQRAVHRPGVLQHAADAAPVVGHRRESLHFKEGRAAKVLVAHDVLRADTGSIDRDVDTTCGQVLRHRDGSRCRANHGAT